MKLIAFVIFLSMTITLVNGFGQNNYHFGLKTGLSVSKFPKKLNEDYNGVYKSSRKEYPLYSPIIGMENYFHIVDCFYLLHGIEYQMTGTRNSGTNTYLSTLFPNETSFKENKTLHKICVPVATGFTFRIKNNESSILFGFRPNFLITGKFYNKYWENNPDTSFVAVTTYNPFKPKEDYFNPLERFVVQFSIILSENISEHLKLNLSLNFGKRLHSYYNEFINNDLNLSITYLFNRSQKEISNKQF